VARVTARQRAGRGIERGVEERDEPIERRVSAHCLVHLARHGRRLGLVRAERADRCLQAGHEQGGGQALAGDIGDRQPDPGVREPQHVVAVPAEGRSRPPHGGDLAALDRRKRRRQQRALNPLRLFELARPAGSGLAPCARLFQLAGNCLPERRVLPRLVHERPRAPPHRFDRRFDAAPTGHGDDRQELIARVHLAEQVQPFTPRRGVAGVVEIHEEQVVVLRAQPVAHLLHRARGIGVEPVAAQQQPQRGNDVGLIVGDEHPRPNSVADQGSPACSGIRIHDAGCGQIPCHARKTMLERANVVFSPVYQRLD